MRKRLFVWGKHMRVLLPALLFFLQMAAQPTFPVNGVANPATGSYAFTNATIVKDAHTTIEHATMIIRDKKIVYIGAGLKVPTEAVVVDCMGKFIYPSFIDIYSDYGIATAPPLQRTNFNFNFSCRLMPSNSRTPSPTTIGYTKI